MARRRGRRGGKAKRSMQAHDKKFKDENVQEMVEGLKQAVQDDVDGDQHAREVQEVTQEMNKTAERELFLRNVDFTTRSENVLQAMRSNFLAIDAQLRAEHKVPPELSPEEAIIACELLPPGKKQRLGSANAGSGFAVVHHSVAALMCMQSVSCANRLLRIAASTRSFQKQAQFWEAYHARSPSEAQSNELQIKTLALVVPVDDGGRAQQHTPVQTLLSKGVCVSRFNLNEKRLELGVSEEGAFFTFQVELGSIKRDIELQRPDNLHGKICLALRLRRPPRVYRREESVDDTTLLGLRIRLGPRSRYTDSNLAQWFSQATAWLVLSPVENNFRLWPLRSQLDELKFTFTHTARPNLTQETSLVRGVSDALPTAEYNGLLGAGEGPIVNYLLSVMLAHGTLRTGQVKDLVAMCRTLVERRYETSVGDALINLVTCLPSVERCNWGREAVREMTRYWRGALEPTAAVTSELQAADEDDDETEVDGVAEMTVPRAALTPFRMLFMAPLLEQSNRVLRRWSEYKDRFLRVTISEESLGPLSGFEVSDYVEARVKNLLLNGVRVGDEDYVFLGFSSSQLREHSCWLYLNPGANARHNGRRIPNADDLRREAGSFNHLRVPAKYAARLGQCFSTTIKTAEFKNEDDIRRGLPDILTNDGQYNFSDGVGVITKAGMQTVMQKMSRRMQRDGLPTAIQIRLGGAKGVLALWPPRYVRGMSRDATIGVRHSMDKFSCKALDVEVITVAHHGHLLLNRPLVMALTSVGIPDSVFWNLYMQQIHNINKIMSGGQESLEAVFSLGFGDAPSDGSAGSYQTICASMLKAGFLPAKDRFLFELCQTVREHALLELQSRCRVRVPEALHLLGIIDETGSLPAGELFFQWMGRDQEGPSTGKPQRLKAGTRVVVGRNPVLSPGELRLLTVARTDNLPDALLAHTNVIVFSQHGPRPETDKMGGGDLDGDLYFVIWNRSLVPEDTDTPLQYTSSEKPVEVHHVQVHHILEHVLNYMKNDVLGRLCLAHLALADGSPARARDGKCQQLAELHGAAVDFAKSGVPVKKEKVAELTKDMSYPDYMEKPAQITFESQTVLGRIYRDAKKRARAVMDDRSHGLFTRSAPSLPARVGAPAVHPDPDLLVCSTTRDRWKWADYHVQEYNWSLCGIMRTYGVYSESEVILGKVLKFRRALAGKEKYHNHQERLNREVMYLIRDKRRDCFPHLFPNDVDFDDEDGEFGQGLGFENAGGLKIDIPLDPEDFFRASALYDVTMNLAARSDFPLLSFPWVVAARPLAHLKVSSRKSKANG